MTAELAIFIAFCAIVLNLVNMWAFLMLRNEHQEILKRVFARLNYLEIGLAHHQLIPLPWEVEDIPAPTNQIKTFKHQGNVVYLPSNNKKGGGHG